MVNNRRSEFDIISKILSLSTNGARKTELLYQGNLSYNQLNGYLSFLMEKNLLILDEVRTNGGRSRFYLITDRGQDFLVNLNRTLAYFE